MQHQHWGTGTDSATENDWFDGTTLVLIAWHSMNSRSDWQDRLHVSMLPVGVIKSKGGNVTAFLGCSQHASCKQISAISMALVAKACCHSQSQALKRSTCLGLWHWRKAFWNYCDLRNFHRQSFFDKALSARLIALFVVCTSHWFCLLLHGSSLLKKRSTFLCCVEDESWVNVAGKNNLNPNI